MTALPDFSLRPYRDSDLAAVCALHALDGFGSVLHAANTRTGVGVICERVASVVRDPALFAFIDTRSCGYFENYQLWTKSALEQFPDPVVFVGGIKTLCRDDQMFLKPSVRLLNC